YGETRRGVTLGRLPGPVDPERRFAQVPGVDASMGLGLSRGAPPVRVSKIARPDGSVLRPITPPDSDLCPTLDSLPPRPGPDVRHDVSRDEGADDFSLGPWPGPFACAVAEDILRGPDVAVRVPVVSSDRVLVFQVSSLP